MSRISAIVPALNEESFAARCLSRLVQMRDLHEIILVDGGSADRTVEIAAGFPQVRCVHTARGRALQMNEGARQAGGDVLWFVHADCLVPDYALDLIEQVLRDDSAVGGAFALRVDAAGRRFRLVEWGTRVRSKLSGVAYGDQAVFVRTPVFQSLGGFPEIPVMEDLYFWRALRIKGRCELLSAAVSTSPRLWEEHGVVKTTLVHWTMIVMDWCGSAPASIADFKRRVLSR